MSLTTMSQVPPPQYYDEEESQSDKLSRKSKEFPFLPLSLGVFAAACVYGAYMYKHRGTMSTSLYLLHLRVTAQGLAVGTLTTGLAYTMLRDAFFKEEE